MMATVQPPAKRKDFRVAIVCALPFEADAVTPLFDDFWDDEHDPYGRADGDTNTYITGRIGNHHVVLAVLSNMGTNSAAAATASLRSSYTRLSLAILVGICGGVPCINNFDVLLGDVVVSKTIIQYDYGRQYPGHFAARNTVEDSLGRANKDIRTMLAVFETELLRERLQREASRHLQYLQEVTKKKPRGANYRYPGTKEDKLFSPTYTHRHREWCSICSNYPGIGCEAASKVSCTETACDATNLVTRKRSTELVPGKAFCPEIFIGRIGSGNTVMKSGEDRDRIAALHDLVAFEMEGAGAWDEVPCIVVKGISDYADSHKNKAWQAFAAATAASVTKAMLGRYAVYDGDRCQNQTNDEQYMKRCSTASSCSVHQGDASRFKEDRVVPPAPKMADPDPVRLLKRSEETGEEKWGRMQYYWKKTNRCLNCGTAGHWEWACTGVCGKCLYRSHTASWCKHPVRCINCNEQGHIAEDCPGDDVASDAWYE